MSGGSAAAAGAASVLGVPGIDEPGAQLKPEESQGVNRCELGKSISKHVPL